MPTGATGVAGTIAGHRKLDQMLTHAYRGKLTKDRTTGKPKITCRNWECGVVVPVRSSLGHVAVVEGSEDMSIFQGEVPVPMQVPGEPYVAIENRGSLAQGRVLLQPWCMK
jgi:hypothetical protein